MCPWDKHILWSEDSLTGSDSDPKPEDLQTRNLLRGYWHTLVCFDVTSRFDILTFCYSRPFFIKMNHYTVPSPFKFLNICQKMLLFNRVGFPKSDIRVYISFRFLSFSPHKSAQCMVTKRNFTSIQVHVLYLFNDFRYTFTLNWWVTSLINV